MFKKHLTKDNLLVLGILTLAGFMRLYRIQDYMTFLGDEGRDVLVAYNILHGHFTLLGPTASVGGFYFGPIYYYFMAPFLFLFNYDPVGPAVMVALFGIATVYLVYKLGEMWFNKKVGFIAAFFCSISPLVITYSRSSWNPNVVPFFSALTIFLVFKALSKNKLLYFFLAGISLGIDLELHFITAIVGMTVFLAILIYNLYSHTKLKSILKQYLFLFSGFVIGWLPYLGFEVRHGFPNTKAVIAFVFHSGKVTGDNTHAVSIIGNVFFRLFGRVVTNFPSPDLYHNFYSNNLFYWSIFTTILGICASALLFYKLFKSYKKRSSDFLPLLILSLWLVIGVLTFGVYKKQIYDYYLGFLFPVPLLLMGNFLEVLFNKKIIFKVLCAVIFIALIFLNLYGFSFTASANKQLLQSETIAKFVYNKANHKPFNFALITGGNSDHAYRYFLTLWGDPPVTIQNNVVDPKRTTVTNQLMVVCESLPCYPLGNPLWEIAGFGRAQIEGHWQVTVVEVYKLSHYKGN